MNDTQTLIVLKMLIQTYFSDDLQFDETPEGAMKRMKLRQAILDMSKQDL